MGEGEDSKVPLHLVERAIRFSCAQSVVGSVFSASLGGGFVVAYALSLGANNAQLGWMGTIPALCVWMQFLAPALVERGVSRKWITIWFSLVVIAAWGVLVILPYVGWRVVAQNRIAIFIGASTIVAAASYVTSNARTSWVGDLIPEERLGRFFGKLAIYGGWLGAILIVAQGKFLDMVKGHGVAGFTYLFLFGIIFFAIYAALFVPQADVPVAAHERDNLRRRVRETVGNRPLRQVIVYSMVCSVGAIAGPFFTVYVLRDLKATYLAFALLSASTAAAAWISSSFWGRMVDRYGCRAIIVACNAMLAPLFFAWFFVTSVPRLYAIEIPASVLAGFACGGVSIAGTTLLYRVTPSAGRSMQIAMYSVAVALFAAPMPAIGGHLPGWLRALGIHTDLRCLFYIAGAASLASAFAAGRIEEPGSARTSELIRDLPKRIAGNIRVGGSDES